jgi:hypothetical protein
MKKKLNDRVKGGKICLKRMVRKEKDDKLVHERGG